MSADSTLYLDRNENLYGPAPGCFDALRSMTLHELSIYSRDFRRGMKSVLSERLAFDFGIPEEQVLLGDGSEDLLKQTVHCYLGPGDRILCPAQSWWYYQSLASEVGGETVNYFLKEGRDAYSFDVDALLEVYHKVTPRIVLVASPNNPTGNSFPGNELERLARACGESIVVLDEAYWGFANLDNGFIPEIVRKFPNVVLLRTFSKFYGLAGARIGFAIVGKSLGKLTKFAERYLGYNRVCESLALAALDSPEYYESIRSRMREDTKRYYHFFDSLQGFQPFHSDANFMLVRIPVDLLNPLRDFLAMRKIQIKFFSDREFQNYVRITIGTHDQNEAMIQTVSEFMSDRLKEPRT